MIKELSSNPQLPIGLADLGRAGGGYPGGPYGDLAALGCTDQLEPGDQVLLYTDGVTEARAADGHDATLVLVEWTPGYRTSRLP